MYFLFKNLFQLYIFKQTRPHSWNPFPQMPHLRVWRLPEAPCRKEQPAEGLVGFLDFHRELAPPQGKFGPSIFSYRFPLTLVSSSELGGSHSSGSSLATGAGEAPHVPS